MNELFNLLKGLMPVWLALLTIGFGYLIYLFAKLTKGYNQLSEKQSEYLQQRLDSVDKTTGIFERTVQHQQKDLDRVYKLNDELKTRLEKEKEIELTTLDKQLSDIQNNIKELQESNITINDLEVLRDTISKTKVITSQRYDNYINYLNKTYSSDFVVVTDLHQAFVSLPFHDESEKRYSIIKPILDEYKIHTIRIDDKINTGELISEKIKSAIEISDIVIIDITESSPNTMYELGYAHAMNKPVILITTQYSELTIDTANYKVIIVDESERSKELLRSYLIETLTEIKKKVYKQKVSNIIEMFLNTIPLGGNLNSLFKIFSSMR